MTNAQIIMLESIKLMNDGILEATSAMITLDGKQLPMPEEIHTYAAWKSLGYQVKKGEKAVAKFPVWKYTSKKVKVETPEGESEEEHGNCRMQTASFFKMSQVEKEKIGGEANA